MLLIRRFLAYTEMDVGRVQVVVTIDLSYQLVTYYLPLDTNTEPFLQDFRVS